MRGYAHSEVFSERDRLLLQRATEIVRLMPEKGIDGELLRCHEVARVVGALLELEVADGFCGFVEHSWCWLRPLEPHSLRCHLPGILDPYVPGQLPAVQLVSTYSSLMPPYRHGERRSDIRHGVIEHLLRLLEDYREAP